LAVLYGAYLFSWAIQQILMEDVLKRKRVEKGTRISIARLLHYALVLIGLGIALSRLGFDRKNITIIGGALGIGIGFGLQTIVSNFVSGLILLFERPLKVGDTIQLGDQWGRVKHLRLRATVIETFDEAEVVVPNANLISGQVTNWTLADRRVRLVIPIGVAYGSDIALVMKTLIECAADHSLVLADPQTKVIFSAFGASSLDLELRVWIADFDDRRTVQSELLLEIDRRFRDLDIEIPFPQSDLHVRSIDESAAASVVNQDCHWIAWNASVSAFGVCRLTACARPAPIRCDRHVTPRPSSWPASRPWAIPSRSYPVWRRHVWSTWEPPMALLPATSDAW